MRVRKPLWVLQSVLQGHGHWRIWQAQEHVVPSLRQGQGVSHIRYAREAQGVHDLYLSVALFAELRGSKSQVARTLSPRPHQGCGRYLRAPQLPGCDILDRSVISGRNKLRSESKPHKDAS